VREDGRVWLGEGLPLKKMCDSGDRRAGKARPRSVRRLGRQIIASPGPVALTQMMYGALERADGRGE
jgi:hypothetical protein